MSRRRQQRREEKERRHAQPTRPVEPSWPEPRRLQVVVREASDIERLAYSRSQAAAALGISRSTLRRLLPWLETIEMPWGGKLIPVDELERLVAERRHAATATRRPASPPGRKPIVPAEIIGRIRRERAMGRSLRAIADELNADHTPTAHGGRKWWPSTVRAVLQRAA
jgi:DNA invertase Pin-like site-specific DNA recombinase